MSSLLLHTYRAGLLTVVAIITLIISGCSENTKAAFRALNTTIENSNETIHSGAENSLKELEEKTKDSASHRRADIWYPLALQAQEYSKTIFEFINNLKEKVARNKALSKSDSKSLEDGIYKFQDNILDIHDNIDTAFRNGFSTDIYAGAFGDMKEEYIKSRFENISKDATLAMLSNYQQFIRTVENRVIRFCNNNVSLGCNLGRSYGAFVGQSSNILQEGDSLELTAGIAEFFPDCKPIISINGKEIPGRQEGIVVTKIKAGKCGKHKVAVQIKYIDPDTEMPGSVEKQIEYTVR